MFSESLLFRGESETLDFKKAQYPFVGADDRAKSELLKDILAMVNAWRETPAFIVIGVDAGISPYNVVGINDHIDDATLQQFVQSKTNKPVSFLYYSLTISGVSVGIIEIPVQARPVYLKQSFGKLTAKTVYLRRGSSTAEALPEEIAAMGAPLSGIKEADLKVQFSKLESRELIGTQQNFESLVFNVTSEKKIPDYAPAKGPFGISIHERSNEDYYRDCLRFVKNLNLLKPLAITVTNAGAISAQNIRVEFSFSDPNRHWEFLAENEFESEPPQANGFAHLSSKISPLRMGKDPESEFEYSNGVWHLSFAFGHLQPGRTLWPSVRFRAGARHDSIVRIEGRVMADALANPIICTIELSAKASNKTVKLETFLRSCEGNQS